VSTRVERRLSFGATSRVSFLYKSKRSLALKCSAYVVMAMPMKGMDHLKRMAGDSCGVSADLIGLSAGPSHVIRVSSWSSMLAPSAHYEVQYMTSHQLDKSSTLP
jgi:hypothetical protein